MILKFLYLSYQIIHPTFFQFQSSKFYKICKIIKNKLKSIRLYNKNIKNNIFTFVKNKIAGTLNNFVFLFFLNGCSLFFHLNDFNLFIDIL